MSKRHDLKPTKAYFKANGLLSGTDKDNFFKSGNSNEKGTPFVEMALNVKATKDTTVYGIKLKGFEQQNVYYGVKAEDGSFKLEAIPWAERNNSKLIESKLGEGAELSFRTRIALEKDKDEKNISKDMVAYDAARYIKKLKDAGKVIDGTPITILGKVVPNTWISVNKTTGENETKKSINLEPSSIYLSKEIDLDSLDDAQARKQATFDMEVIVKEFYELNGKTYMKAIIVGYDYVEEMEFQFQEPKLAKTFKTLSPYTMIRVQGAIVAENQQEEIVEEVDDDPWCAGEEWNKVTGYSRQVYVIGKGQKETIDTESYTKEAVEKAIKDLIAFKEDYKAGKTVEKPSSKDDDELTFGTDEFGNLDSECEFD